ncbi:MAG: phosphopyruvate hydratase [Ilumatobacteraceae bacterium]
MTDTEIVAVRGARRWDSRGRPTVAVTVTTPAGQGTALAPAGASTGSGEAVDLRDGGAAFGGLDVRRAMANVDDVIAPALTGHDAADQAGVDAILDGLDTDHRFAHLGGNAAVATSMAVAHAAAAANGLPLWHHLDPSATQLPVPEIQIFGGGAHAHRRVDLQDFLVVPGGAGSFAEALDWVAEIHRAGGRWLDQRGRLAGVAEEGGWWPAFDRNEEALDALTAAIADAGFEPGRDVGISLDIAATQLRDGDGYRLGRDATRFDRDGWLDVLAGWIDRYPIVSVEDAFAEDDTDGMRAFTGRVGDRVQVVGDDFLVTDAARVRATTGAVNAALIKPNQAGTLTRARAALDAARAQGWTAIVSARSGETEDATVADLSVGWGSDGVKVGSITRGERTAKWNALLQIEEDLGAAATYRGWAALGWPA